MFKNADLSEGLAEPGHRQSSAAGGFRLSNLGHALGQFRRLNSWEHPGLRPREFKNLFCQCGGCRLVMTKQAFLRHSCPDIIDLTTDEVVDLTTESETEVEG